MIVLEIVGVLFLLYLGQTMIALFFSLASNKTILLVFGFLAMIAVVLLCGVIVFVSRVLGL